MYVCVCVCVERDRKRGRVYSPLIILGTKLTIYGCGQGSQVAACRNGEGPAMFDFLKVQLCLIKGGIDNLHERHNTINILFKSLHPLIVGY